MRTIQSLRTKGYTLAELTVSLMIMSFIFAFMGYLIWMSARNAANLHEQVLSQTKASSAAERASQVLRNACFFAPYGSDEPASGSLRRMRFATPDPSGDPDNPVWGVICFDLVNDKNAGLPAYRQIPGGELQIYLNEDDVTFTDETEPEAVTGKEPDYVFNRINDLFIDFESEARVTMRMYYTYNGFALRDRDDDGDGVADNLMTGQFITDVIAKNHHVGEGYSNYGETTGPANLFSTGS